jgi:hypothetical protein
VRGRCSHRLSGRQRLSDVSPFWIVKLLLLGSLKDVEKSLKDVSTMMFLPLKKNSFPTSWSIRWLPYNDIYSCKWYLMDMFISTWMGFNMIYPWNIGIYTLNIVFAYYIYMNIAYIYIQVYLFMCLLYIHTYHTYIRTYVRTYMHACIHTYLLTYILTYILSYILTYLHTYIRTYVHTCIRTYVHT